MATAIGENTKARHDTANKLKSIGLRINLEPDEQIITSADVEKMEQITKGGHESFEGLMRLISAASNESLMSSLLAGPDNESDDPVDVPILLGRLPANCSLIDYSLASLGIHDRQQIENLIVRESVDIKTDESSTKEVAGVNEERPWMLSRIYEAGRMSTSTDVKGMNDNSSRSLDEILLMFRPRIHFEFQMIHHPSLVVCTFIGQLPALILPDLDTPLVGGLISYRIQS